MSAQTRSLSVGNYPFLGKKLPVCRQVSGGVSATISVSDAKVLYWGRALAGFGGKKEIILFFFKIPSPLLTKRGSTSPLCFLPSGKEKNKKLQKPTTFCGGGIRLRP